MDSSQDVFLDQSMDTCNSSFGSIATELENKSYESLLISTKKCLAKNKGVTSITSEFYTDFKHILNNSHDCVKMGLDSINIILKDSSINLLNLIEHIDNIAFIVQELTDFLTNTVEVTSMSCKQLKSLPIAPGNILVMIFTHCKESELLYDGHLPKLEKQLKDLFRASHNLQLVYLMLMEKNLVFDLSEESDYDVLIEALNINLIIGEIVQSLDVKTMADQWKGYTNICEKYANYLVDDGIFIDTTNSLSKMANNNITIALERNQEQKKTVRSLKVTSFVLKILLKICHTFKHAGSRDETHILDLIIYIYMQDPSRLLLEGYQPQLVQMLQPTILTPADGLIAELIADDNFVNCVLNYDYKRHKKDDHLLGYILTLIAIIKAVLSSNEVSPLWVRNKTNIVSRIVEIIPYCYPWLNLGLKYPLPHRTNGTQTYSLYEYVLTHTASMLSTYTSEQYSQIERLLYENIMQEDCCAAVFCADLLAVIAKLNSNKHLLYDQLTFFSIAYKELETEALFNYSPQKAHLSYTIQILYHSLEQSYKQTYCKQFNILDADNTGLWIVLKIKSLSRDFKMIGEETAVKRMIEKLNQFLRCQGEFSAKDMKCLINSIKLASTCSIIKGDNIEGLVTQAWSKLCPNERPISLYQPVFTIQSAWQLEYFTALVNITETMLMQLQRDNSNLVQILHIISSAMTSENIDLKLISTNLILKLSLYSSHYSNQVNAQLENIFRAMLLENNMAYKNKFYDNLRKYLSGKKIVSTITNIVNEDQNLLENWNYYLKNEKLKKNEDVPLKQQLFYTTELDYKHKCLTSNSIEDVKLFDCKSNSGNFDMYDINSLLTPEFDEPVPKKPKLDKSEINTILNRIEKDVQELCRVKENISDEERCKISAVIGQLKSVIEY